jgi:predicted metal-dependent TIM-barrel fold hydrolase
VLGIGEIGLNKNTRNEATVFLEHLELAAKHQELVLVHTPHLADKYQGTRMILDMVRDFAFISPERVCIDHVEEHTIRQALDAGHWVGMTLYPITKCTPARAADMVEMYGPERIMVNSAGDWGHSDPLAVPEFIFEMRRREHGEALIRRVVYDNPLAFFSQCSRFEAHIVDDATTNAAR